LHFFFFLGSIGEGIAKAASGFGMKNIWGYNRTGRSVPNFTHIVSTEQLPSYLAMADIIVNLLPSTPQTSNFLNKERLKCISEKSILLIPGRGTTYDSIALKELIIQGKIRRTVVDVFEVEPLPRIFFVVLLKSFPPSETDSFWSLPGVTITPHNAAAILIDVVAEGLYRNIDRFLQNEPLKGIVDFERGY
jgi:glyoxylate/hydroxypyruvate reductase A